VDAKKRRGCANPQAQPRHAPTEQGGIILIELSRTENHPRSKKRERKQINRLRPLCNRLRSRCRLNMSIVEIKTPKASDFFALLPYAAHNQIGGQSSPR
jgi:hypothetical protein